MRRRWRVNRLPGSNVDYVILDLPVLARPRCSSANTLNEALVNLSNQALRNGAACLKILKTSPNALR